MFQRLNGQIVDERLFDIRQIDVVNDDDVVRFFAPQALQAEFEQPVERVLRVMCVVMVVVIVCMGVIVVVDVSVY